MSTDKIIIAIDGYSSSGKSTMAKKLARTVGYRYIDSGAMYRAVTLAGMRSGNVAGGHVDREALVRELPSITVDFALQPDGSQHTLLCGEDVEELIRGLDVSENVSQVAVIAEVRRKLTEMQQALGAGKGIVMDGRDIGTTVFPHAEMKVFVTASPETRARRRLQEMLDKGQEVSFEEVLANVVKRDHIDETRKESPLRKADDAIVLDNSYMTTGEQDAWLLDRFNEIISRR